MKIIIKGVSHPSSRQSIMHFRKCNPGKFFCFSHKSLSYMYMYTLSCQLFTLLLFIFFSPLSISCFLCFMLFCWYMFFLYQNLNCSRPFLRLCSFNFVLERTQFGAINDDSKRERYCKYQVKASCKTIDLESNSTYL